MIEEGHTGDRRPAAFLDRDGTLIHDRHYLADPEGVVLLPRAAEAVRRLNEAGLPVVIVTNQSGIGRGYFGEEEFRAVQRRVMHLLGERGARVDAVYHCPHAPDSVSPCDCRKPATGLFERAALEHRLDLHRSMYVGDRSRDVEPACRWGGARYLIGGGTSEASGTVSVESLFEAVEQFLAGSIDVATRNHYISG